MNKLFTFCCCLLFFVKISYSQNSRPEIFPVNSREVIEEGIKLFDEDKFDEALSKLKQVSKSDTNYVWSLYERALTHNAKEQYDQTIKLCEEGISYHTYNDLSFYCLMGTAYDYLNQTDKALTTFDKAIAKFPQSYRGYFEKAGTYKRIRNYVEAVKLYEKSISLNFMHFASHYNLGLIYAANGYTTQAALCYQTAILMDSQSKRSFTALLELEKVLTVHNTTPIDSIKELKIDRSPFEEIELLLQSNAALQKSYVIKTDIDYKCLRQIQVILEKLGETEGKGFIFDYYVPFYTELWKKNYFQPFSYYMAASIDKKAGANINKPDGKVKDFFQWAVDRSKELRDLHFSKEGKKVSTEYYKTGALASVTETKDSKATGPYVSYYSNGHIETKGNFNENEQKVGEWIYYDEDGNVTKTENHTDSKTYTYKRFHNNGVIEEEGAIEDDNFKGIVKNYSRSGALNRELTAVQNKIEGKLTNYYDFGGKRSEINFSNGAREGIYTNYHINGAVLGTGTYKVGKETGPYKEYYISGKIKTEGVIEDDQSVGEWKWYYENGNLQKTGSYKDGKENGLWIFYDEDGKKNNETSFADGLYDGLTSEFKNDKVYNQYVYKNNKLKSYTSIPKNYTVTNSDKGPFIIYNENGIRIREGNVKDGGQDGLWHFYDVNGILLTDINFSKGKKEGNYKYYHPNGKVKIEGTYVNDSENGVCSYYFITGTLESTGTYVDGNKEGEWFAYYENGKLKSKEYYSNGTATGLTENYRTDGTLDNIVEIKEGYLDDFSAFDSNNKMYENIKLKAGNGKLALHHVNGKPLLDVEYVKGNKQGKSTSYYANGQVSRIENYTYHTLHGPTIGYTPYGKVSFKAKYTFGNRDSVITYYDDFTGVKESTFPYKNGNCTGECIWYNPDGSISSTSTYKNDVRDGYSLYFDEIGKNIKIRVKYNQGTIVSYSYLNNKGEFVPEIPIGKEKTEVKAYYSSGTPSMVATYQNGLRQGKLIHYHPNGKVEDEEDYIDGERNGVKKVYYADGTLQKLINYKFDYKNGEAKYFNQKGELIGEEICEMGQLHGACKKLAEDGKSMKTIKFAYGEPVL
ncbi:hypothetical protein NF867_16665 [Solitalea sp. MAHUQ-68]|uniref:Antitoxin component YwqK of the YwqJK toxin-antitoxin module n=1 Tax=Solitalea agri TaxID=2953739 RepID=A0A9X2F4A7_9SPHI|nr:hypothetical protein [Solitalea agri]MCO4294497.1 hypothetical protein [Solitalea agri]